jgi:hypothetical protein
MMMSREFWKDLEDMISSVFSSEKLFIGGDLNVMLVQLERGLRGYIEVLDIAIRTKKMKS